MVAELLHDDGHAPMKRHLAHRAAREKVLSISLTIFGSCRAGSVAIRSAIVKCASRTQLAIAIEKIPSVVNGMRGDLFLTGA
jgi:hypothetical protein